MKEIEAKKLRTPENTFEFLAAEGQRIAEDNESILNVPVFPFTASRVNEKDGVVINIGNQDDFRAFHEADLIAQKVKSLDSEIPVRTVDPSSNPQDTLKMFMNLPL